MSYLEFKNITKTFDERKSNKAVNNANLNIEQGELVVFVGPSGCGKSTFLRMMAGLEDVSEGEIILDGKVQNDIEVRDRNISMVFQDYALYPHMTVAENLTFGLKNIKMKKQLINEKINKVMGMLELDELQDRYPKQLSGGQRQRVALGRAIVKEPKVFLLDEPLSNLDSRLRINTRKMIADLHKELKSTMIYVTHDQIEAMTLGDKIVVMNKGEIQQIDSPEEIYLNPQNTFVANFIGTPSMNLIETEILDNKYILFGDYKIAMTNEMMQAFDGSHLKEVILGIRPEDIRLESAENATSRVFQPKFLEFLGSENLLYFDVNNKELIVKAPVQHKLSVEDKYKLTILNDKICLFDKESKSRIY